MLKNKTVIFGICGGIAAYKSAEITSRLKDLGADIWVVMTKSAQEFVAPLTFKTLSTNPVVTDLFSKDLLNQPVPHISLTQKADILVIAPASANMIGKMANGIADDALSTMAMAATCVKLIAPAMNNEMWDNLVVQENVKKLEKLGFIFIGPNTGKLACGDISIGRMSEPKEILEKIIELIGPKQDLKGKKILVTAGGTKEAIDPVRFIGNRSSGKMGYAIAEAASMRGAEVTLVSGETSLPPPALVKVINAKTSDDMYSQVMKNQKGQDAIIMAAAVSDFKPKITADKKIKKGLSGRGLIPQNAGLRIKLEETKDILAELGKHKNGTYLVGFALETDNLIKNAKEKLKAKNLDMIVANDTSAFDSDSSQVTIIKRDSAVNKLPKSKKSFIANKILDQIA